MIKRLLTGSVLALLAGSFVEAARAEQIFVCDDGRTLRISNASLEDAKRHDPCVAKSFGRAVRPRRVAVPERNPRAARRSAARNATHHGPAVGATPTAAVASATSGAQSAVRSGQDLRPGLDPDASPIDRRLATLESGTYRRVRVINAGGASAWYRHTR